MKEDETKINKKKPRWKHVSYLRILRHDKLNFNFEAALQAATNLLIFFDSCFPVTTHPSVGSLQFKRLQSRDYTRNFITFSPDTKHVTDVVDGFCFPLLLLPLLILTYEFPSLSLLSMLFVYFTKDRQTTAAPIRGDCWRCRNHRCGALLMAELHRHKWLRLVVP